MANVLPDPLPGQPAGPESRAADAAVAQLRRLDAALASLPAAAGASASALAAVRAELLRSRGAVQAVAGRMPAPALRAAEARANLLIPGSEGRSDPGSAGRDANAMAASARFAEARRRALSDTRIAGALRDQAAAMRGGGAVQIPGSEREGGDSPGRRLADEALKGAAALSQMGQAARQAFGMGAGAIASLGQAAGAVTAWPTLMASIEGVKIELGQGFLPAMDKTSMALQDMEQWLETVSPATKEYAARLLIAGTASAGTAYAVIRLVQALQAMRIAAAAAWAAMTPAGAVLGVIGLTAAVGGAAAAWALTANNARDAAEAQREAGAAGEAAGGASRPRAALTTKDIGALPPTVQADIEKARAAGDAGRMQEILAQEVRDAKEALEKAKAEGGLRSAAETRTEREEAEAVRRDRAARPLPPLSDAERERYRENVEGREEAGPDGRTRRVFDAAPMYASGDPTAAAAMAREGRRAGRYGSDAEEKEAELRFLQRFRRERAGLPFDDVMDRRARAGPLDAAEARMRAADVAARKTGADRMLTEDRNVPAARILDMPSLADAIQIKALEGKDKTNENLAKQLGVMGEMKAELVGMRSDLAALKGVFPTSYGRWGRADEDPGRD